MIVIFAIKIIALTQKLYIFAACFYKHTYKQVACAVLLPHKELGNSLQI